jgi:hypothetical protein
MALDATIPGSLSFIGMYQANGGKLLGITSRSQGQQAVAVMGFDS